MIDRQHIENLLRMNGLEPTAPDEEIKEILIRARWHEDDVETALVILREDPKSKSSHVDTLHNIFNTNEKLAPDTLNAILGIDVEVNDVIERHRKTMQATYNKQIISLIVVSVLLAAAFLIMVVMYFNFDTSVVYK